MTEIVIRSIWESVAFAISTFSREACRVEKFTRPLLARVTDSHETPLSQTVSMASYSSSLLLFRGKGGRFS